MKSLVISLTSAKIRRRTLEIAFQEKGIEFSYIDAIDATTLNQNMISELILPERRDSEQTEPDGSGARSDAAPVLPDR